MGRKRQLTAKLAAMLADIYKPIKTADGFDYRDSSRLFMTVHQTIHLRARIGLETEGERDTKQPNGATQ